jgi:hypothetical protein
MRDPGRLFLMLWYGLGVYLLSLLLGEMVGDSLAWLALVRRGLLLLGLAVFFHLAALLLRRASWPAPAPSPAATAGDSFPSQVALVIGLWLIALSAASVSALFIVLRPESGIASTLGLSRLSDRLSEDPTVREALVTLIAGCLGSCVTTILGYLKHASVKRDFDRAFSPWYVARPLMGALLALVFYFLVKGGLWATIGEADQSRNLNLWTLAGTGALVGLFSKDAIEKLRELFQTMFSTRESVTKELLERLPKDLQARVAEHLTSDEKPEPEAGRHGGDED